ncbi:MAG: single-stranded DNA-binding protein [Geobacteraceae bacterium]|nr:single-stranded DNA-binding protein [Geobacteraceae bacterium]
MSRGLNKVMLIGHLGNDPERRETASGQSVCNFTVATSESFKDSAGELQERTEWHRIVVWGKLADICSQYLKKGAKVYIEGKLQTRSWEKDVQKQYTTEIICNEMQMLGSKGDGQAQQHSAPAATRQESARQDPDKDDLPF